MLERERACQEKLNDKTAEQIRLLSGQHTPEQANAVAHDLIKGLVTTLVDRPFGEAAQLFGEFDGDTPRCGHA